MPNDVRRFLVSFSALAIVLTAAAFKPSGNVMCQYACGIDECPSDLQEMCEQYCGTSLWVCGNVEWCNGELGYHCGPL